MSSKDAQPSLEEWLEPPQMDPGTPQPAIHFDRHRVRCAYHTLSHPDNSRETALVQFEGVLDIRVGPPNDEAIHGHPLFAFGLRSYAFYIVRNSPHILELEKRNRVHSQHRPENYLRFSHWIATFHDEMLEVVASRAIVVGTSQVPPAHAVYNVIKKS